MSFTFNEYEFNKLKGELKIHQAAIGIMAQRLVAMQNRVPTQENINQAIKFALDCARPIKQTKRRREDER